MSNINNQHRVILLEGSPYNRGLIHGRVLKEEIRELVDLWKNSLKKRFDIVPDVFIKQFLNKTDYLPAIKKYTPNILDEVRGIVEGSGVDFDTIFTFQLLDEFILNSEDLSREHCTTIGSNKVGSKPTCLGQNWDIEGLLNGFQTLFHIKEENSDLESFVFTYAGFIAAFGMNNKQVGICVNSIGQLNYSQEGLPIAFFIRGVLERNNQEDAIKFLYEVKHASPQNYLIGGPEKVYDFECSSNKVSQFKVSDNSDIVFHTNHALRNDDYNPKYIKRVKEHGEEEMADDNSHTRFNTLEKRLAVPPENVSVNMIKSTLSSHDSKEHPICMDFVDASTFFSFGSVVMVLSEQPECHLAFGPPVVNPYKVYKFD